MMKKLSLLLALLLIFTMLAAGCGKTEDASVNADSAKEAASDIDLNEVKEAIVSGAQVKDPIDVASNRLVDLYGIEESQIKQAASFITIGAVFPDEIVMIEAVDDDAAKKIAQALEKRLAEVKVQSKSYDPESYALALECTVDKNGRYVSMFLAPGHAEMKSIYGKYVK